VDVHFTWRSRDLFTAWQSNIICLTEMLNREVVKPNNCRIVRIIDYSDSLHLYARDIADAKKVSLVPVSPQELQQGS
jgi:thymidylate synthase